MAAHIRNMRFRYTKNPERVAWTEKFYPHALTFLKVLHAIPWETYTVEIDSQVAITPEDNNNAPRGFSMKEPEEKIEIRRGTSKLKKMPYTIFGGAACEILNLSYPNAGNLHLTADPTSDIDILLQPPIFHVPELYEEVDYQYPLYLHAENDYTPLINHYTKWVFDRVVEYIGPVASIFDADPEVFPTVKEDTHETSLADMEQQVGKLLITRLHREDMIKIQITAKLGDRADHLLEFVMTVNDNQEPKDIFNSEIFQASGFFIESPIRLLQKQIKAIEGRQEVEPEILYKLKNHYGRVYYLLKAFPSLVENGIIVKPSSSQFNSLAELIQKGFFSNPTACSMPTGCNLKKMLSPIRRFLLDKHPPWKDILPRINALEGGRRVSRARKPKKKSKHTRRH